MATLAAQVTPEGISAPDYSDVLQQLRIDYYGIYGSDSNLDDDSQDGQFLSVFAQAVHDVNQLAISVYNSFSPATAQFAALSNVVKINGIARQVATNSQCIVTIVGEVGVIITDGIVGDSLGLQTQWALPATVTIPVAGTIDVTATCTEVGATVAAEDTLTVILTPTRGWQSVNNVAPATAGEPVQTDAQLRQQQAISTALPALTVLESIVGGIADLSGVSRSTVYENDTDIEDAEGVPPHAISAVVEGGDVIEIATVIAQRKAPGASTYGTTSQVIVDQKGLPNIIRFFALAQVPMTVEVDIEPLSGYVSTTGDLIRQAIVDFLNGLAIGEDSYLARLYTPANLTGVGLGGTYVVTAIRQGRDVIPPAAVNVAIAFNAATICSIEDVSVTVIP